MGPCWPFALCGLLPWPLGRPVHACAARECSQKQFSKNTHAFRDNCHVSYPKMDKHHCMYLAIMLSMLYRFCSSNVPISCSAFACKNNCVSASPSHTVLFALCCFPFVIHLIYYCGNSSYTTFHCILYICGRPGCFEHFGYLWDKGWAIVIASRTFV